MERLVYRYSSEPFAFGFLGGHGDKIVLQIYVDPFQIENLPTPHSRVFNATSITCFKGGFDCSKSSLISCWDRIRSLGISVARSSSNSCITTPFHFAAFLRMFLRSFTSLFTVDGDIRLSRNLTFCRNLSILYSATWLLSMSEIYKSPKYGTSAYGGIPACPLLSLLAGFPIEI